MAFLWFFVIVSISISHVFAIDCSSVVFENVMNCDECIRCGGFWCNKPSKKEDPQCAPARADDWCPDHIELLPTIDPKSQDGDLIKPKFRQGTLKVAASDSRDFVYEFPSNKAQVTAELINSTQRGESIEIIKKTQCDNGLCTTKVKLKVDTDFCYATGTAHEFFHVKLHIDSLSEEASLKYHVPCACECSKNVDKDSKMCNGNGDYSCGVCKCHEGWTGASCQVKVPDHGCDRGDLQCTHPLKSEVECSGNGRCGKCDCICFTDTDGSQYFDKYNYCADICMTVNECDTCLEDRDLGQCPDCLNYNLITRAYNESLMTMRDLDGRKVFVNCEETLADGCHVNYVAGKDEHNNVIVMRKNSCKSIAEKIAAGGVSLTLPIVLGAIAFIAATVAVVGYFMWKNRDAPIPPASAQYQELDGPKTRIEENPTYKSPTTSYNNPMWKQKV